MRVLVRAQISSRRCQSEEHDADLAQADGGNEALEALAVTVGARESLVTVDDDDLLERPAEGDGPLLEGVLALGALGILEHLAQRRLADVEVGEAFEVARRHLQMLFRVHVAHLLSLLTISQSNDTSSARVPVGSPLRRTGGADRVTGAVAHIHAATPPRKNTARPRGVVAGSPPHAWARNAS
jgi:hypothetical protein